MLARNDQSHTWTHWDCTYCFQDRSIWTSESEKRGKHHLPSYDWYGCCSFRPTSMEDVTMHSHVIYGDSDPLSDPNPKPRSWEINWDGHAGSTKMHCQMGTPEETVHTRKIV